MSTLAPTPAEVDKKAVEYRRMADELLQAMLAAKEKQQPLEELKAELIELVRKFGGPAPKADKSKLVHGLDWELFATFGTTYSQDSAAIEKFRLGLKKAKQVRLLKKLFIKTERWDLSPEAAVIVRGEKLSKPLLALYSQCSIPKPRTPTLQVREKEKAA